MEITKTEKFDLAAIRVPETNVRSPLTIRMMNLEVGEGFEVRDIERETLTARAQALKPKKFTSQKLGKLHYRIIRLA